MFSVVYEIKIVSNLLNEIFPFPFCSEKVVAWLVPKVFQLFSQLVKKNCIVSLLTYCLFELNVEFPWQHSKFSQGTHLDLNAFVHHRSL